MELKLFYKLFSLNYLNLRILTSIEMQTLLTGKLTDNKNKFL